jgi:putative ABC transport system permease protein
VTSASLIFGAFRRHKTRTLFTIASITIAFAVYLVLATFYSGIHGVTYYANAQRMMVWGETARLPLAYLPKVANISGVTAVNYYTTFAAEYANAKKWVYVMGVEPNAYFKVYPEYKLGDAEKRTFLADRQGAVTGAVLARKMGWKIGDTIRLQSGPVQKSGSTVWVFHLVGILGAPSLPEGYQEGFITHYAYINEGRADVANKDTAQNFQVMVDDPRRVNEVAHRIETLFAYASPPTLAAPDQMLVASVLKSFGDISALLVAICAAVFFSMLLVTGNTMASSVRDRLHEFAVLRALGFTRLRVAALVLREAAVLIGTGAALGIALGWQIYGAMKDMVTTNLPAFVVTWKALVLAALLALVFAVIAGLLPARRVTKLAVADTLRRS